jgi:predicted DNA-binding protein YlxM (UPF0122 family)
MSLYKDPKWLFVQYCKHNLSCRDIGKKCGVTTSVIYRWIKKLGIPRKTNAQTLLKERYKPSLITYRNKHWLKHKYIKERFSLEKIGRICRVSGSAIYRWMKKHGIQCRTYLENNSGHNHPNWGRRLSPKTKQKMSIVRKAYIAKHPEFIRRGPDNALYVNGHGKNFPYPIEFDNKLKDQIKKRDDYQCQFCGLQEDDKRHHIHHIDYQITNNNPANLITVCLRHNSQANYGRDKWQFFFETYQEIRRVPHVCL